MKEEFDNSALEQREDRKLKILRFRSKAKRIKRPKLIEGPQVGFYLLPNLFTSAGLLCGFWAILKTFDGNYITAAWLILAAAFFDGLDGRIARLTRTASEFGMYFDSLSDVVAFGIATSITIYKWALAHSISQPIGSIVAFGFALCGALRLARFNVLTNKLDKEVFIGLPIPSAACVLVSIILLLHDLGLAKPGEPAPAPNLLLIITALLAYLMVSTIEYPSFKNVNLFKRQPLSVLLIASFVLAIVVLELKKALFVIFTLYAMSGPILWFIKKHKEEMTANEA